ncbi:hypothetical protein [Flavobacterium sp. N3904]|uniref:hypothetical protein n=1 Tax=Flavobacterium sp. N3904 TaxID=2986835 RepID=UPI0022246790|nr:hypothetical protein [Flavobacterium sp. N3904]
MKLLFYSILFLQFSLCFSQNYSGQITTNENDSLNVQILIKGDMIFKNNKILSIQEKITVVNNGASKDYYPKDLKSFKIKMENDKIITYDNIDNNIFAERYYSNKVKLYYKLVKVETRQSPYFAIYRVFLVKNPNQEKMIELIPNGFSRLITQKEMLNKFTDCKISFDKITNDEFKIRNEEKLVEFIIDYEKNCFNN